jgi:hypothetical protein
MFPPHCRVKGGRGDAGNQQRHTFLDPLSDVSSKVNYMEKVNKYITTRIVAVEIAAWHCLKGTSSKIPKLNASKTSEIKSVRLLRH